MEGYWNADRDDDADFIHTVRTKGEKINEYFFDTGEADAPFKETHYLYDGVKYRIYDYRFDNSAMELLDKSTKKSIPSTKSFNDMVKEQRGKNTVKKTYNGDDTVFIKYKLSNGEIEEGGFDLKTILIYLGCEPNKTLNKVAKEVVEHTCGYDYGQVWVDKIIEINGLY